MKLFGIGTNKTGTVSMQYAFEAAGLRVLHDYDTGRKIVDDLKARRHNLALGQYDVFLDGPYYEVAKLLLNRIPGSRLLYHWRPKNEFIASALLHVLDNRLNNPDAIWLDINTEERSRTWDESRAVAFNLIKSRPDEVFDYRLGDNIAWRKFCKGIGLEQVPDLEHYHTAGERFARIEAHYQIRKSIRETPIVLAVRTRNWNDSKRVPDLGQNQQWLQGLEWWKQTFAMPYQEYRTKLARIARTNWARIDGIDSIVCARSWEIERFSNAIVIPIDDDDWLDPEVVPMLRNCLDESHHAACWEVNRIHSTGCGNYASWFNGSPERFATNGYALTPRYFDLCQSREYRQAVFYHLQAARPDANTHCLPRCLGIAPRTMGSVSHFRRCGTLEQFQASAKRAKEEHKPEFSLFPEDPFGREFVALWNANKDLYNSLKV